MRICRLISTGQILDSCQGGSDNPELETMRLNVMKQNAINAGYAESDIEVKWVTDDEYVAAQLADPVFQAEKLAAKAVAEKLEDAKVAIKTAIRTENADLTKWKIEEVVARIKGIETILGLR